MAADRGDDRVPLDDLAAPFARHLCEHLKKADKQATSPSSRFLDACRAFNRGEIAEDSLVETTARLGFANVIDAFHIVGSGPVPVRFFVEERASGGGVRLTDDLRLAASPRTAPFRARPRRAGGWSRRCGARPFIRPGLLSGSLTISNEADDV